MHRRMGDVLKPEKVVSKYIIRACFTILECHRGSFEVYSYSRMMITKTASIIITGFYNSVRGEEMEITDLGAMIKCWNKAMNYTE